MLADEILAFYNETDEAGRLVRGFGPLEFARSQELISRYLPGAPAVVFDIGAGPGAYGCWLAELGYQVHMIDAVPRHIEQAKQRARAHGVKPASIELGDARSLPFADASADAVVIHGPLYHLTTHDDRLQTLREAKRVVRPGGFVLAFAVTRYASLIVGVARGWVFDADYLAMCDAELASGQHRRPESWPKLFTTAYFHSVDALREEVVAAGLAHQGTFGVEGLAWLAPNFESAWQDAKRRDVLLKVARDMENDPTFSPHMMAAARRIG